MHVVDDVGLLQRSGADQMLHDEEMLTRAGDPVLRLYTWAQPALSLGRFQPDDDVDHAACARRGVEVVRRPSGGRALLHGWDLTYAVAMRRAPEPVRDTYCFLAAGLVAGLARLGVDAIVTARDGGDSTACLSGMAGADLAVAGRKVCGSAMVRRGDLVLQHGSILLTRADLDETDLLRAMGESDRAALRAATVTLEDLGAPTEPEVVAEAVVEGFVQVFDTEAHGAPTCT